MARSCTEVGPGDYIKVGGRWKKIVSNTAHGETRTPRSWTVTTEDGGSYGMFGINAYAKAEDVKR
jgi:hypothetical protein